MAGVAGGQSSGEGDGDRVLCVPKAKTATAAKTPGRQTRTSCGIRGYELLLSAVVCYHKLEKPAFWQHVVISESKIVYAKAFDSPSFTVSMNLLVFSAVWRV